MRRWLSVMCHPDGQIALFNDAAMGIAARPAELDGYASWLGLEPVPGPRDGVTHLPDSGFVRMQHNRAVVLLDVGRIGPDYVPGHAHADTLTFELSIDGQRMIVNSGTSCYGNSPERIRQRGTAAHNTVVVEGQDSSEVWAGFQVARRAYPLAVSSSPLESDELVVAGGHNGYRRLPGRVIHRREWRLCADRLEVRDSIHGRCRHAAVHFHLHPDVTVTRADGAAAGQCLLSRGDIKVSVEFREGAVRTAPSTYHPEFGAAFPNTRLGSVLTDGIATHEFRW